MRNKSLTNKIPQIVATLSTMVIYLICCQRKMKSPFQHFLLNKLDLIPILLQYIRCCCPNYPHISLSSKSIELKKVSLSMGQSHTKYSMDQVQLKILIVLRSTSMKIRNNWSIFLWTKSRRNNIHLIPSLLDHFKRETTTVVHMKEGTVSNQVASPNLIWALKQWKVLLSDGRARNILG